MIDMLINTSKAPTVDEGGALEMHSGYRSQRKNLKPLRYPTNNVIKRTRAARACSCRRRKLLREDGVTGSKEAASWAFDKLAANGATFTYRPTNGSLPPSFTYEMVGSSDRRRCLAIIDRAKADPAVCAAMLAEIASRTGQINQSVTDTTMPSEGGCLP